MEYGRRTLFTADGKTDSHPAIICSSRHRQIPKLRHTAEQSEQTLRSLGLWERIKPRLVYGENIAQTFQFVSSQKCGIRIRGTFTSTELPILQQLGSRWDVPPTLHDPVIQEAVLLNLGSNQRKQPRAFLAYHEHPISSGHHQTTWVWNT